MAASTISPPLGALGFTQGQCGKSAGRPGSPSRESAWVRRISPATGAAGAAGVAGAAGALPCARAARANPLLARTRPEARR
ncbi:hypothetical protein ACFQU7_18480 [Pseudoroseomonas wenyumeiae]